MRITEGSLSRTHPRSRTTAIRSHGISPVRTDDGIVGLGMIVGLDCCARVRDRRVLPMPQVPSQAKRRHRFAIFKLLASFNIDFWLDRQPRVYFQGRGNIELWQRVATTVPDTNRLSPVCVERDAIVVAPNGFAYDFTEAPPGLGAYVVRDYRQGVSDA